MTSLNVKSLKGWQMSQEWFSMPCFEASENTKDSQNTKSLNFQNFSSVSESIRIYIYSIYSYLIISLIIV